MAQPIRIRASRSRMLVLATGFGLIGLMFTVLAVKVVSFDGFGAGFFWGGLIGVSCLVFALYYIGIAVARPVALRLDADGISGYYTGTASWSQILKVGLITTSKQQKILGFALLDPVAFRDGQTPWRRLLSHLSGRNSGYHLMLSEAQLKEADIQELFEHAQQFHKAASV